MTSRAPSSTPTPDRAFTRPSALLHPRNHHIHGSSGFQMTERTYALQDANDNVTFLVTRPTTFSDTNEDGTTDISNFTIVSNYRQKHVSGAEADGDLNHDGIVDIQDETIVTNNWTNSGSTFTWQVTERLAYDGYGKFTTTVKDNAGTWHNWNDYLAWNYTFQGGRFDRNTGLLQFQARPWDTIGRWVSPEPSYGTPYVDGPDLYPGFGDNPINLVDPMGLADVAVLTVKGVGYSLPTVNDHETYISVAQAKALGILVPQGNTTDISLGPHLHGDNGTKYFPRYNVELDIKTKTYSTQTPKFRAKFLNQCKSILSPQQKARIGVMALALGAIILNEASGANAQNVHDLENDLNEFNNAVANGDSALAETDAPFIADKIRQLFNNDVTSQWALGELLKIANK